MEELLIIDGNALVHRAFHAYPPFAKYEGKTVNAVYGFFAILIKAIEEIRPAYLAICFDRPAPTFRKLLYAGYQTQRPVMPGELSEQIDLLHEALAIVGVPIYEVDGYEADDLIGTLSVQAKKHNIEVIILSGDRDLLQLVNSHTKVMIPIVGITKKVIYDEKTVLEKYGVLPSQVTDYKALIGDNSDGYPGVNGIGPKTAQELLKTFGTFENIYSNLNKLPEKTAKKLAVDAEQAALAKKLATLVLDAPINFKSSECSCKIFTPDKFIKVFDRFNFKSLKKRFDKSIAPISPKPHSEGKKQMELI